MCYQPTEEELIELYNLTHKFVYALWDKYFIQYTGDLDDLASDYFMSFITPKSRSGEKLVIWDHYNPDWREFYTHENFEGYVRTCVMRKLIDSSRVESNHRTHSITQLVDDYGDLFLKTFELTTEDDEELRDLLSSPKYVAKVVTKFNKLPEDKRNQFFFELMDSNSILTPHLRPVIHFVHGLPVYQITESSIMCYDKELNRIVKFSKSDGHAKGDAWYKYQEGLTKDELSHCSDFVDFDTNLYWSGATQDLFIEFCNNRLSA